MKLLSVLIGAASTNLIMASPTGKNLFQKAIVMSASALLTGVPGVNDHYNVLSNIGIQVFRIYLFWIHFVPNENVNSDSFD